MRYEMVKWIFWYDFIPPLTSVLLTSVVKACVATESCILNSMRKIGSVLRGSLFGSIAELQQFVTAIRKSLEISAIVLFFFAQSSA